MALRASKTTDRISHPGTADNLTATGVACAAAITHAAPAASLAIGSINELAGNGLVR